MRRRKRAAGYLLLETLISISLLAAALTVTCEAISNAQTAMRKTARSSQETYCAQLKLLELGLDASLEDPRCVELNWAIERTLLTPRVEQISIRILGPENRKATHHEKTFQIARSLE